jgi:type IV pilus assembly protein PilW
MLKSSPKLSASRGFSLIELMIAVGIGMLGIVIIFQVLTVNEGYRRTTVGRGDAQNNGAVAMFSLERQIRSAGSGITTTNEVRLKATEVIAPNGVLGCVLAGMPTGYPALRVAPVQVADGSEGAGGAAGASDTVYVMSGTADVGSAPTSISGTFSTGAVTIGLSNLNGIRAPSGTRPGDLLLFTNQGFSDTDFNKRISFVRSPAPGANHRCSIRRVASVTGTSGSGSATLSVALPGPGITYNEGRVHNLGPVAYFLRYTVSNQGQLVETDFLPALAGEGAPVERIIADGIVNLQLQYGLDLNQDDVIDGWVNPKTDQAIPANAPATTGVASRDWSLTNLTAASLTAATFAGVDNPGTIEQDTVALTKIKAVRLAMVARSTQYESPPTKNSATECNATPDESGKFPASLTPLQPRARVASASGPAVMAAMPSGGYTVTEFTDAIKARAPANTIGNDWKCFRYRTYETVVPIRNMLWSPL